MKRTKLMLGVAAVSAALLGTGYAAMTDMLTIGGTVTTATFNVEVAEGGFKAGRTPSELTAELKKKYEIENATVKKDDDDITITVEKLKPGVPVVYETTMTNMSNIDAALKNITVTDVNGGDLKAHTQVTLTVGGTQVFSESLARLEQSQGYTTSLVLQENGAQENGAAKDSTPVKLELEVLADGVQGDQKTYAEEQTLAYTVHFDWQQTTEE